MGRGHAGDSLDIFPPEDSGDPKYEVYLIESEGFWELFKASIPGNPGIGVIALSPSGKSRWVRHPDDDPDKDENWKQGLADA